MREIVAQLGDGSNMVNVAVRKNYSKRIQFMFLKKTEQPTNPKTGVNYKTI
jgi:hypothetical protein